jgi:hypothetical protein
MSKRDPSADDEFIARIRRQPAEHLLLLILGVPFVVGGVYVTLKYQDPVSLRSIIALAILGIGVGAVGVRLGVYWLRRRRGEKKPNQSPEPTR